MKTLLLVGSTFLLPVQAFVNGRVVPAQAEPLELSCSVFPRETSESDLIARFGAGNVTNGPVIGLDDGPSEGTVLFHDRNDARLEILWADRETKRRPTWIMVKRERSRWLTTNGITVGTDLLTLEQANRRPFRLAGLETELQGAVISWAGGRLETHEPGGCRVMIHIQPRFDGTEDFALMRQVRSGREYSSGHPAMQQLNPRVAVMWISFERQ